VNVAQIGAGALTVSGGTIVGTTVTTAQYQGLQFVYASTGTTWYSVAPFATAPGLAIVTPSSIANSGGSASASAGEVTFTGVTSISLNGVFSSAYDNYCIKIYATNSSAANFLTRMRTGSDDTGANYADQLLYGSGSSAGANRQSGATSWRTGYAGTSDSGTVTWDLFAPNLAAATKGNFAACVFLGGTIEASYGSVANSTSTQYTGFSVFPGAGNFTGKIRVYGYKNS
jgi:hypothetical protein